MSDPNDARQNFDRILEAVTAKLRANQAIVERSAGYCRITVRLTNGKLVVDLEPKI